MHLHSISEAFTTLVKNAVDGHYEDYYFGGVATDTDYHKRIRAFTTNMLEQFATSIRSRGHKYEIIDDQSKVQVKTVPYTITRQARLEQVRKLVRNNRGKELSYFCKEENVTMLFRDQCSPLEGPRGSMCG